jgi:hypothetical protein
MSGKRSSCPAPGWRRPTGGFRSPAPRGRGLAFSSGVRCKTGDLAEDRGELQPHRKELRPNREGLPPTLSQAGPLLGAAPRGTRFSRFRRPRHDRVVLCGFDERCASGHVAKPVGFHHVLNGIQPNEGSWLAAATPPSLA